MQNRPGGLAQVRSTGEPRRGVCVRGIIDEISAVTDRNEPEEANAAAYARLLARYRQAAERLGEWAQ
jgi:hypothetical protein